MPVRQGLEGDDLLAVEGAAASAVDASMASTSSPARIGIATALSRSGLRGLGRGEGRRERGRRPRKGRGSHPPPGSSALMAGPGTRRGPVDPHRAGGWSRANSGRPRGCAAPPPRGSARARGFPRWRGAACSRGRAARLRSRSASKAMELATAMASWEAKRVRYSRSSGVKGGAPGRAGGVQDPEQQRAPRAGWS